MATKTTFEEIEAAAERQKVKLIGSVTKLARTQNKLKPGDLYLVTYPIIRLLTCCSITLRNDFPYELNAVEHLYPYSAQDCFKVERLGG